MRLGKGKVEDKVCYLKINKVVYIKFLLIRLFKDEAVDLAVAKINSLLEMFMGIHDSELGKNNFKKFIHFHLF